MHREREREREIDELCVMMIMMTTTNVLLYKVNDDGRDVCLVIKIDSS